MPGTRARLGGGLACLGCAAGGTPRRVRCQQCLAASKRGCKRAIRVAAIAWHAVLAADLRGGTWAAGWPTPRLRGRAPFLPISGVFLLRQSTSRGLMVPHCRRAPAEREDGASGRAHHAWIRGGMMYAGFRGAAGHNVDGLAAPPVRTGGNKHGPAARRAAQRSDPAAETSPGWYAGPRWVRQLLRVLVVADIVGGSVRVRHLVWPLASEPLL